MIISKIPEMNQEELMALDGQSVKIRGFLYGDKNDRLILDTLPNLKSCCIGSECNIKRQVVVCGSLDLPDDRFPILVQGIFHFDPLKDRDGRYIQYMILSNPQLLSEPHSYGIIILIIALVLSFFLYKLLKK